MLDDVVDDVRARHLVVHSIVHDVAEGVVVGRLGVGLHLEACVLARLELLSVDGVGRCGVVHKVDPHHHHKYEVRETLHRTALYLHDGLIIFLRRISIFEVQHSTFKSPLATRRVPCCALTRPM